MDVQRSSLPRRYDGRPRTAYRELPNLRDVKREAGGVDGVSSLKINQRHDDGAVLCNKMLCWNKTNTQHAILVRLLYVLLLLAVYLGEFLH